MDENRFFKISLGIVVLFILGVVLKLAKTFLFPFFLAVFISYLLDPALSFLIRTKIPKPAAIVLVLLLAFVFLYLLGVLLYSSGKSLAVELPGYEQRINEIVGAVNRAIERLPFESRTGSSPAGFDFGKSASFIMSAIGPFIKFVTRLLLVFLFLVFIFAGRGRLQAKLRHSLSSEKEGQIMAALQAINQQIRRYLAIKTVLSLFNGFQVWVVLEAFGVDFAPLFGFLAFLLNYIPTFGSFIAASLRVGFAYFQFGTVWVPLWVLVITVGIDATMGSFVEPRIMGKKLGLSPLVVLFSLLFWSWLWGIPGMVLAVPIAAVVKIVCQNIVPLRPLAIMME